MRCARAFGKRTVSGLAMPFFVGLRGGLECFGVAQLVALREPDVPGVAVGLVDAREDGVEGVEDRRAAKKDARAEPDERREQEIRGVVCREYAERA